MVCPLRPNKGLAIWKRNCTQRVQIVLNRLAHIFTSFRGLIYDPYIRLSVIYHCAGLSHLVSLKSMGMARALPNRTAAAHSSFKLKSKLLDAAGIANGRVTGNGHTWNAAKIDGKWCQMDLTWDDTSDNWYGDLEQRLAVARAVYSGSPVLLLDERTSALDPKTEREMLDRMRNLGHTVIIVTHRSAALEVCDRVVSL